MLRVACEWLHHWRTQSFYIDYCLSPWPLILREDSVYPFICKCLSSNLINDISLMMTGRWLHLHQGCINGGMGTLTNTDQCTRETSENDIGTQGAVISHILNAFSHKFKHFLPQKMEAALEWEIMCGSLSLTGNGS